MNAKTNPAPVNYPRPLNEIVAEMRKTPEGDYEKNELLGIERKDRVFLEASPKRLAEHNRRNATSSASAQS